MTQEDISQESSRDSPKNSKDTFFDPKPKPKMIRILTVLAYVLSVSMAAIFLSVYYIFIWRGEPHLGAHRSILVNHSVNESNEMMTRPDLSSKNHFKLPQRQILTLPDMEMFKKINNGFVLSTNISRSSLGSNETSTVRDMQQQLTALETEVREAIPTSSFEENITTFQDEYPESSEDLTKTSSFMKKLFDSEDENY